MQLLLTPPTVQRLQSELRKAGEREIGGLLMGEHVSGNVFRVADLTVQHSGGNAACFIRRPDEHQVELDRFFERTGADYRRFNYLGEWHSHPSFAAVPSETDTETMRSIASDPSVGANFVVLMIVKLDRRERLHMSAHVFRQGAPVEPVILELEGDKNRSPLATVGRLVKRIFRT